MELTIYQLLKVVNLKKTWRIPVVLGYNWSFIVKLKEMVKDGSAVVKKAEREGWKYGEPEFDKISNFNHAFDFSFCPKEEILYIDEYDCDGLDGTKYGIEVRWELTFKNKKTIPLEIVGALKKRVENLISDIRFEEKKNLEEIERERVKKALLAQIS